MDTNDDLNGSKNRKKQNNKIHTLSKTTEYLKKTKKMVSKFFSIIEMTLIPRQSVPDLLNEGRGKKSL